MKAKDINVIKTQNGTNLSTNTRNQSTLNDVEKVYTE